MSRDVIISVVICTYNRGEIFKDTLRSLQEMEVPDPTDVELLLVDNKSTDATEKTAKDFIAEAKFRGRYIYESHQGLTYARNAGIDAAKGEIVAFVDDDVFFDRNWLSAMLKGFREQPTAAAVGGKSIPIFDGGRPAWLEDEFLSLYGDTRFGEVARWLKYPEYPFGLNMAFRKAVFAEVGQFNRKLGRKKTSLLSNEELEMFGRVARAGLKVYYSPDALLHHRIPKSRISPDWIIDRFYWQGISDAVLPKENENFGRFGLLCEAISGAWRALTGMRGGRISPRHILWHYKGLRLRDKAWHWSQLGRARQKLRRAIGL